MAKFKLSFDKAATYVFPLLFGAFNICYWTMYLFIMPYFIEDRERKWNFVKIYSDYRHFLVQFSLYMRQVSEIPEIWQISRQGLTEKLKSRAVITCILDRKWKCQWHLVRRHIIDDTFSMWLPMCWWHKSIICIGVLYWKLALDCTDWGCQKTYFPHKYLAWDNIYTNN